VTQFRVGEPVYAMLPNSTMGGYAEYAAVEAASVARIPAGMTFTDAAAVPCAGLTALQALRDFAHVKPGMNVLVNGASGGVGSFGVQIAKAMGAHVSAITSTRNLELVRGLGVDAVIDYTSTDITAGEPRYDVVFDAVGLVPFGKWQRVLRPGGVGVTVNLILGSPIAKLRARLFGGGRKWESLLVKPAGDDLTVLNDWLMSGSVRPVIDKTYPLSGAADAHRYIESKRVRGKLVLMVDEHNAARTAGA
jgi:NADPH:quinone reductase-like Zn-dependent oxidoreductase